MDTIGIGDLSRRHQMRDVEVRIPAGRATDAHGLIGEFDVEAVLVGRGIYRDGLDTHFAAGSDHTKGDLTPVRDQYLLEIYLRVFCHVEWLE